MFDIKIDKDYLVDTAGTSDGTQLKYFYNGYWYKENCVEREGEVEYLVSKMLTFSDLKSDEYVLYEQGKINGMRGCRSKNFLGEKESFITLERLHSNVAGIPLYEEIKKQKEIVKQVEYVLAFVRNITGLDLNEYFKKIFTLDYITLNEDRHFHNLGIILNSNGEYRPAPIFDNGISLLNGNSSKLPDAPISTCIQKVVARPFSGSHKVMFDYFGKGFNLDIDGCLRWLKTEENSLYKRVLEYQLNKINF